MSKLACPDEGGEGKGVQGTGRVRVGRGRESDNQTRTASSPAAVDEIDDDDFSESARDERHPSDVSVVQGRTDKSRKSCSARELTQSGFGGGSSDIHGRARSAHKLGHSAISSVPPDAPNPVSTTRRHLPASGMSERRVQPERHVGSSDATVAASSAVSISIFWVGDRCRRGAANF